MGISSKAMPDNDWALLQLWGEIDAGGMRIAREDESKVLRGAQDDIATRGAHRPRQPVNAPRYLRSAVVQGQVITPSISVPPVPTVTLQLVMPPAEIVGLFALTV